MVENGYVSREEGDKAKAEPLGVTPRRNGTYLFAGEYFTEEVRREIIARYGENALYEGGLSVRTTLDPKLQLIARKAMQRGLLKYDTLRGYRGPVTTIEMARRLGRAARRGQGPGRCSGMAACRRARSSRRRASASACSRSASFGRARRPSAKRARSPRKT